MRALAGFVLLVLFLPTVALAQTPPDLRARVEALGQEVEALRAAAAEMGTVTQGLADVSAEIERLKARLAEVEKGGGGAAGTVERMDALDARLGELTAEVASLRAAVQAERAPESASAASGGGFTTADGRFSIKMGGYAQLRFLLRTDEVLEHLDEASALLRRARLKWSGNVWSEALSYRIMLDFGRGNAELLDYYVEGRIGRFTLRGGQFKMPFSRSFLQSAETLAFVDRAVAVEEFRYDRDLGVLGSARLGVVDASVAIVNGAGRNVARNDNLDPLIVARVVANVLGRPDYGEGDLEGAKTPELAVGMSGSFENAPVPDVVDNMNTDVDGDGQRDNVRVMQAGVDVVFRLRGLEVTAEGFVRKEDWGTIGDAQTPPIALDDTYLGGYAQATYFIVPSRFLVGARGSWTEVSPLRLAGKPDAAKAYDVQRELTVVAAYYRYGHGIELTAMWSFIDWATEDDADEDPLGVGEQRFILEAQVAF